MYIHSLPHSAIGLVNSTTPHAYDLRTQTYLQPVYAYQTLQRLLSTNLRILSTLNTQRGLMLERREIRVGTPLVDLINIGIKEGNVGGGKEQGLACVVLEAVMTELGQQRKYVHMTLSFIWHLLIPVHFVLHN